MAHAYAEQPWSGGRLVGLLGAIAVNVALIAAISGGLRFNVEDVVLPPKITLVPVVSEPEPEPLPVPVPQPVIEPMPQEVFQPPVLDEIVLAPAEVPVMIPTAADPLPPQPTAPPVATQLQADPRYPLAQPIYPPWSIRRGEQGVVTLLIYVKPDGRVGDVRIKRSSGFLKLDEAAVMAARKDWRFQPATQGGAAVAAWGVYAVSFELKDLE